MGVFFTIFEKVKKHIFACNFFKMGPMDLKTCAKKTCNRSGSSPKILSKSDHFSKIYYIFKMGHILFPSTVHEKTTHFFGNPLQLMKVRKSSYILDFDVMKYYRQLSDLNLLSEHDIRLKIIWLSHMELEKIVSRTLHQLRSVYGKISVQEFSR